MKARMKNFWDRIFYTPLPIPPGTHQAMLEINGKPYRLHLRIESDGLGILILNASTVLHLNPTATEIAYYLINKTPVEQIPVIIANRYQISAGSAAEDVSIFKERLDTLINTPDLDPETFLDMDRVTRHVPEKDAPIRLDCALTYQVPSGSSELYAPVARVNQLLDSNEWMAILNKSWEWGIPHVVFTGGEPTLRPDLVDLITHAEQLGQVTGVITDGLRLSDGKYRREMLNAGLDHLMILLDEDEEGSWEAIRDVLQEDIHLTVHLTLTSRNITKIRSIIAKLKDLGVTHLSLSSPTEELKIELSQASHLVAEAGMALVYELPVPYTELNPVNFELEEDLASISGAGRSWIYVEPDGDVLPGQGILKPLGNLVSDSWISISGNLKLST